MRILIVDDNKLLQQRLEYAIKKIDNSIIIIKAMNCKEAIEKFTSSNPDFVILDISLPDGSGIDVLPKFKQQKPLVKVCMFTNHSDDEFKKQSANLGADWFFMKSNMGKLIDLIGIQHKRLEKLKVI